MRGRNEGRSSGTPRLFAADDAFRRRALPALALLVALACLALPSTSQAQECVNVSTGEPAGCGDTGAVTKEVYDMHNDGSESDDSSASGGSDGGSTWIIAIVAAALAGGVVAGFFILRSRRGPVSVTPPPVDGKEQTMPADEDETAETKLMPGGGGGTPPVTPVIGCHPSTTQGGAMSEPASRTEPMPAATTAPRNTTAGWYENPHAPGQRYYDGERWTDAYAPPAPETASSLPTLRDLLWGLALGFGAMGAIGAVAIPLIAFYFPLGAGIASGVLILAAVGSPGENRWWAALAVIACLLSIGSGVSAYNEFNDASDAANDALENLGNF
jgi:hypothetical protein